MSDTNRDASAKVKRDKKLLACFRDTPSDLVFWSFRYFLGRRTIQACDFAECLSVALPYLDEPAKGLICRDLEEEFERDDRARKSDNKYLPLGDNCDREAWEKVRRAYDKT